MELKLKALFLALILPMSYAVDELASKELLRRTMPVYALAATGLQLFNRNNLELDSEDCPRELQLFRNAVDERVLWALKMLDASGVPKPGFIFGNNFWLGVRSQCMDLRSRYPLILKAQVMQNNSVYRDVHTEFPPFELNYFVAYFRHNSTLQYHIRWQNEDLMTLGLCMPASCTESELNTILKVMFQERTLIFTDLYSSDLQLIQVKDLKDDHRWLLSANVIIILLALILIVLLVILGTLYEIFHEKRSAINKEENKGVTKETKICENSNVNTGNGSDDLEASAPSKVEERLWGRILLCFSVHNNTRLIFSRKLSSDFVKPIPGLRFLGLIWIIFIHPIYYMMDYNDNKVWVWKIGEGFAVQVISNASLSVDTYFFMSGFLLAYIFYRRQKDGEKTTCRRMVSNFFLAIFKRFIRLTPAYMMVIGIVQLNGAWYERTSQFYMNERPQDDCGKYWWRNILYINNLFGRDTMCMSWSWYLSNDMQFFVIGMFLLTLSTVYFYLALTLLLLLIFCSITITGYIVYAINYIPTLDEQYHMLDAVYDPPWTRIGPYLVGMITAYIIIKLNGNLPMQRKWVVICWTLSSLCNLIVLFGIYEKQISLTKSIIYVSLSRTAWGVGLAWLLIACCTKHGGIVNKILCLKTWIPLSKLTYCAYLLNPFIISSIYLQTESAVHLDLLSSSTLFLGILILNFLSAYVLSVTVELPIVLLMRTFIDEKRR